MKGHEESNCQAALRNSRVATNHFPFSCRLASKYETLCENCQGCVPASIYCVNESLHFLPSGSFVYSITSEVLFKLILLFSIERTSVT